ncbi:MAG: hypothetical protein ACK4GL_10850 [Flavobacteriales bacterium]
MKIEIYEETWGKAYLIQQFGAHQKLIDSTHFSHHTATFNIAGLDTGLYVVRYQLKQVNEHAMIAQEVSIIMLQENIHLRIRHKENKPLIEVPHSFENQRWQQFLKNEEDIKARLKYIFAAKEIFETDSDVLKSLKDKLRKEQRSQEKQLTLLKANRHRSITDALMYCSLMPIPPFEFDYDEVLSWQPIQLFERCEFDQQILLRSNVYENIVFNLITAQYDRYVNLEEREKAVLKSIINVLEKSKSLPAIQKRLLSFVRTGVERMQLASAMKYLDENFPEEKCESDNSEWKRENLQIGMTLPADGIILLKTIDSELITNSRAILIFWAGWCTYSDLLAQELRSKPISKEVPILLIDLALGKSNCGKSRARFPDWFQYYCDGQGWDNEAAGILGINALPSLILLDEKQSIIALPENIPEMIQVLIDPFKTQ